MDIFRSHQRITGNSFMEEDAVICKNAFDWYNVEEGTVDEVDFIKLYLNSKIYFTFKDGGVVTVTDTSNNIIDHSVWKSNSSYHNISVYKTSDKCGGFAWGISGTSTPAYSQDLTVAFDSTDDNTSVAVIIPTTSGYGTIIDGKNDISATSTTPYGNNGYNASYVNTQLILLQNVRTGAVFDNIQGIFTTNVTIPNFANFGNRKYLFSRGIALPVNDEITYHYMGDE